MCFNALNTLMQKLFWVEIIVWSNQLGRYPLRSRKGENDLIDLSNRLNLSDISRLRNPTERQLYME